MRTKRILLAAGVVISVALATAGCSASAGTSSNGPKLLGIVSIASGIDMNDNATKGSIDAAKAAGWTVEVVDAQGDASKANAAITNFVNKGADAIITHVFPATALGSGLAAAQAAKVPVASWGGGKGAGVVVDTVTPLGKPSTDTMVADLGGKGSILALTYHGGQLCIDRETALDKVLTAYPAIKVTKEEVTIPGFLQDGAKYANTWLASHPAGSGPLAIWGCWDDPTLGAISSLKQQNRTDVLTYGIQGSKTSIAAVADGSLTATAFEDGYNEGKVLFTSLQKAIAAGDKWKPETLNMTGQIIKKPEVAAFLAAHPEFK
ncbi:MAG: sugar transporter substrate-binding protein [Glaciihabitans sp.]|jgi:ribose transport system substrate-binding protein|nr:sugar transporter substrate-binding protein [Glaciihabitans sp.]